MVGALWKYNTDKHKNLKTGKQMIGLKISDLIAKEFEINISIRHFYKLRYTLSNIVAISVNVCDQQVN